MVPVKINDVEIDNVVDKDPKDITDKERKYGELQLTAEARLKWQLLPFEAFGKLMRKSSKDVATTIKAYLAKTFNDIRGVNIVYIPPRIVGEEDRFDVELFFSQNQLPDDSKISSILDISNPNSVPDEKNMYYKMQKMDNRIAGHHFTLNDETRLLLADMMHKEKKHYLPGNKIWNDIIEECWVPTSVLTYGNTQECILKVSKCININKVLKKIYGNQMVTITDYVSMPDGSIKSQNHTSVCEYKATYDRQVANDPNAFIMNIHQFSRKMVENFVMAENPIRREALNGVFYY